MVERGCHPHGLWPPHMQQLALKEQQDSETRAEDTAGRERHCAQQKGRAEDR